MNLYIEDDLNDAMQKNEILRQVNSAMFLEYKITLPIVEVPPSWKKWAMEYGEIKGKHVTIRIKKIVLLINNDESEKVVADVWFDKSLMRFVEEL